MIQFDEQMCFKWVGEKPPPSNSLFDVLKTQRFIWSRNLDNCRVWCIFAGGVLWNHQNHQAKKIKKVNQKAGFVVFCFWFLFWVVVSNIFYVHPYLGKIPILTNIFQLGWNHQLVFFQESSANANCCGWVVWNLNNPHTYWFLSCAEGPHGTRCKKSVLAMDQRSVFFASRNIDHCRFGLSFRFSMNKSPKSPTKKCNKNWDKKLDFGWILLCVSDYVFFSRVISHLLFE